MPEEKRPLKVFLSHAHSDANAVRALYDSLTADGVDAWLDKEKLLPGQDWELEIRRAVREADVVVVCLSKQFNQAGYRQKEVRLALNVAMEKPEGEIFIIPARLEDCDSLESLHHLHWVDLFEDNGYDKLTQALFLRAQQVGATTYDNSIVVRVKTAELQVTGESAHLSNLGSVYQEKGDFSKAIEYFEKALRISKDVGDRRTEIAIVSNLASVYERVGDLIRAADFYEQALALSRVQVDFRIIEQGQILDNRYQVTRIVAITDHSQVVKAWDISQKRNVAIKSIYLSRETNDALVKFKKLFVREAELLANLNHNCIAKVYDVLKSPMAIVMEWIDGVSLQTLFEKHQVFSLSDIIRFGILVADALTYVHNNNIIHRDIKPSNIMITTSDQPVLMGFGIAHIIYRENIAMRENGTYFYIGTPAYSAPEQSENPEHITHGSVKFWAEIEKCGKLVSAWKTTSM